MSEYIDLINKFIITLFRTNGLLLTLGKELASKHSITTAKWKIIGALKINNTELTVPQIAHYMSLTR